MKIIESQKSNDGITQKFLQKTDDNFVIETAYINDDKHFLCYSSQIGCPVACTFCYNGVNKNFTRNLTKSEIVEQCSNVIKYLDIFNREKPIKFGCMGVGEPLLNYKNVIDSTLILNDTYPHSIFSLATIGLKPKLVSKLANHIKNLEKYILTISLHASNDETRKKLMPMHDSMLVLRTAADNYKKITNHEMCWNYILLKGINDSKQNAKEFSDFLEKGDTVKLTVFSSIKGNTFKPSNNFRLFREMLENKGIEYYVFDPSGKDIDAGCGQMSAKYYDNLAS
jgi:23S rRNA (adenine2503-C2)-methyltransferase